MTTDVGLSYSTLSTLVDWEAPLVVSAFVPSDFSRPQPTEPIKKALRRLAQVAAVNLTDQFGLGHGVVRQSSAP